MRRILVVGTSGVGKSTLARQLADTLGIPFFATDPFYWQADWQPATAEQVDSRLADVLHQPEWVLDGNFERQWQQVWSEAHCIVWLDYPLATVLRQVTLRNFRWLLCRNVVWSGNRMTLRRACSGVRHALRSHAAKRRRYAEYLVALKGVAVHRFVSRRQTRQWLLDLAAQKRSAVPTAA